VGSCPSCSMYYPLVLRLCLLIRYCPCGGAVLSCSPGDDAAGEAVHDLQPVSTALKGSARE
jgi:hypothetical protein